MSADPRAGSLPTLESLHAAPPPPSIARAGQPAVRRLLASSRAAQWVHFLVLPVAAMSPETMWHSQRDAILRLAVASTTAAALLGFAYGLNAWADRDGDLSHTKNPLAGRSDEPGLRTWLAAQAASAVVLAGLLGPTAFAAAAVSLVASTLYSIGPRLKARPIWGTLLNAGIFAPLLILAVATPTALSRLGLLVATFLALLLQNQLLHELADADEDAASDVTTTARWLGTRRTRIGAVCWGLGWAAGLTLCAAHPAARVTVAAALLAASAVAAWGGQPARRRRLHRMVALCGGAALWLVGGGT